MKKIVLCLIMVSWSVFAEQVQRDDDDLQAIYYDSFLAHTFWGFQLFFNDIDESGLLNISLGLGGSFFMANSLHRFLQRYHSREQTEEEQNKVSRPYFKFLANTCASKALIFILMKARRGLIRDVIATGGCFLLMRSIP